MNKIYFAYYNAETDCIEIYIDNKISMNFNCTLCNQQVHFKDPLDIAWLYRLAREEPFNYADFACKPNGLQGYVDAMDVFN